MTPVPLPQTFRLNLYFDASREAPEGPGFYMAAGRTSEDMKMGEILPRIRLSNDDAIKFLRVAEKFTTGKALHWSPLLHREDISLGQAGQEAIACGKEIIEAQLQEAEAAAAQVDRLRKLRDEFGS